MNIKNRVKRYFPVKITSKIKEIQMCSFKGDKLPTGGIMPLYNSYGELMNTYYLHDTNFPLEFSATDGRIPRFIYWDRARYSLPIHFYTDDMLFTTKGKPTRKFGMLLEPSTLQPKKYSKILNDPACVADYDTIFTHDQRVLEKLQNTKPLIVGGVYVGTPFGGGSISEDIYLHKKKNISIVSSNKRMCALHEFRYSIAKKYENDDKVDCFGTFNGKFIKIAESLEDYRYSFAIENNREPLWITERICNCFATMTVPIYLGSPDIGKYFNINGIIIIEKQDLKHIEDIVDSCDSDDYKKRIPAIKDNFERVKQYYCLEDWLYYNYKDLLCKN